MYLSLLLYILRAIQTGVCYLGAHVSLKGQWSYLKQIRFKFR